jgi:PAS domain S-box-containing protein
MDYPDSEPHRPAAAAGLAHQQAQGRLRDLVARADSPAALQQAIEGPWLAELRRWGIPAHSVSVQVPSPRVGYFTALWDLPRLDQGDATVDEPLTAYPWVGEAWASGQPVVAPRPRLDQARFGLPDVQAILEVPFPDGDGSFGINTTDPRGFDHHAVATVTQYAGIVATATRRIRRLMAIDLADRSRTEESLRLQAAVLNSLTEAVYLAGLDDRIIRYANPRLEQLLGYGPDELIGRPVTILDGADAADGARQREAVHEALRRDGEWHGEWDHRRRDGATVACSANASVFDHGRAGTLMVAVLTDITRRRRAEADLRQAQHGSAAEQRLRLSIASMAAPEDLAGVLKQMQQLLPDLGATAGAALSLRVDNAARTESIRLDANGGADPLLPIWTCGVEWSGHGSSQTLSAWVTGPPGTPVPPAGPWQPPAGPWQPPAGPAADGAARVQVPFAHGVLALEGSAATPLGPQDGDVLRRLAEVVSAGFRRCLDLVDRRRDERTMTANLAIERVRNVVLTIQTENDWLRVVQSVQDELRPLMGLISCSVCLVDAEAGTTTFYRPAGSESQQRVVVGELYAAILHAMHTGQPVLRRDPVERAVWGEVTRDPFVSVVDVPFGPGTLGARTPADRPFTAADVEVLQRFAQVLAEAQRRLAELRWRQRAEAELAAQRLRVVQADRLRALGEMATGVAHELNQPLNGIRAFAEGMRVALQRGWSLPAGEQVETLTDIIEQVDRASAIIDHMRVFARDEPQAAGRRFAVSEPVAGALKLMAAQLRVHGIDLQCDSHEPSPRVEGHANQLEQVLINLLSNARDALEARRVAEATAPPGARPWRPTIRIHAAADPSGVRLSVSDNGGGIAPAVLERVFEPFFTTKEVGHGTGIGLALARAIIDHHRGRIEVDNHPGEGVTFTICLPAIGDDEPDADRIA